MSSNERTLNTLRAPHISEKSARLAEKNQYVFVVAPEATKADVLSPWNSFSTSRSRT